MLRACLMGIGGSVYRVGAAAKREATAWARRKPLVGRLMCPSEALA